MKRILGEEAEGEVEEGDIREDLKKERSELEEVD